MAVFVMSVGILSMVVLYPLGLRESTQGQADLKQTMLADFMLNQAVAAASQTNITWSQWTSLPRATDAPGGFINIPNGNTWPSFMANKIKEPDWQDAPTLGNMRCRVACVIVPGFSDRLMGIMVQSTELTNLNNYNQYSNNPIFYAEAMFQGNPAQ